MADALHVVCPRCGATNRLPAARLEQTPKCGQCHELLFNGQPVELSAANFRKYLEHNDVPVVVDFWAPWCGPCRMMAPHYAEAATELEPRVRVARLNTDADPGLAGQFDIRGIPTLILFKGGREIARQSGAMGKSDIVRWVRSRV